MGIVEANRTLGVNFGKLDCSSGSFLPSHREQFACFSLSFFFPPPPLASWSFTPFHCETRGGFLFIDSLGPFSSKMGTLHVLPPE